MCKRKFAAFLIIILALATCACSNNETSIVDNDTPVEEENDETEASFDVHMMNERLIEAAYSLERSEEFSLKDGIYVTALGLQAANQTTGFDDNFLLPAIERMTGIHFAIDWKSEENYTTAVATTILSDKENLPDLISPKNFGLMDLADDDLIIALDDYLYLMPDIVKAVGEENMDNWRAPDGHIYTIPSVSTFDGSFATMVRKDWLDELGMEVPDSWNDWVEYWEAVLAYDLNHNGNPHDELPFVDARDANGERSLFPFLNAYGIMVSDDGQFCLLDDGSYTMVYEHPRYKSFLNEMVYLYSKGIIPAAYESFSSSDVIKMMKENCVGTAFTYASSGNTATELRNNGISQALWVCTKPMAGPYGNRLIPKRTTVTNSWCITAAARKRGHIKDIISFFNWCYTKEGSYLLNYGIEGISYEIIDGKPVMNKELVAEGFNNVLKVGLFCEPFGGLWLKEEYLQCLFGGKTIDQFNDIQKEVYRGIFELNDKYYYSMPQTIETEKYVKNRANLITRGVCELRDRTIRGELTCEDFWNRYAILRNRGLRDLCDDASKHYAINNSKNKGLVNNEE